MKLTVVLRPLTTLALALGCRRDPATPSAPSRAPAPDAARVRPPPPRVETAPVFYGAHTPPLPGPDGSARFVAGDLRVEVAADGAVRAAPEALPTTVALTWCLDDGRCGFITADDQVFVTDGFLGPVVMHVAMAAAVIRHATGAVPAVRTDDGAWHRITASGPSPMPDLGVGVMAVHFVDDRVGWALRAPGEALRTVDGGARWRVVPLPGDIALRIEVDARGAPLVQGARARYAPQGDALVATDQPSRDGPTLEPAALTRALERWEAHWRANRWPTFATAFWIERDGEIHPSIEHRGALWWWKDGAIHSLGRDGQARSVAMSSMRRCALSPFGETILATCRDDDGQRLFTVGAGTVTPSPIGGLLPLDATITAARDGGAIALRTPGFPAPQRLWTRSLPSFRPLAGAPADATVIVEGDRLLALSPTAAQVGRLTPEGARWSALPLDIDGEARVMSLRPDGGYAIAGRSSGACAVVLGAAGEPPRRVVVPGCATPAAVAFADARFGVVVDGYTAWVTLDGGDHWSPRSRPVGGARDEALGALARAAYAHAEPDALYVAPGLRFTRAFTPESPYRARAPLRRLEARVAPASRTQLCEAQGAPRVSRPALDDPQTRGRLVAHDDAQAALTLRREGDAVRVNVTWRGSDGAGSFEGAAPWRDPVADFTRGESVGYALRAVSEAGALLERCEIEPAVARSHDARACDVVWFTPAGQARAITLHDDRAGAGARVLRVAPDNGGWVLELGSGEARRRWEWVQWQHRAADGSLARWGDLTRDLQRGSEEDLARVGGRWGVRTAAGFIAHGETAARPMPAPAEVSFCDAPPSDDADLWIAQGTSVPVVPRLWAGGPSAWVLRRGDSGWCVARGHDAPSRFFWSTATHRPLFPAWRLQPGSGVRQAARPDGTFEAQATRCDDPR